MSKNASQVQKDSLDQVEAFWDQMTASSVKLAKDTLDYSVGLANQWRKLGMEAAKKALQPFENISASW